MKAYELMKLAAEDPQKYEGKRYKVVVGTSAMYNCATRERYRDCEVKNGTLRSGGYYMMIFSDTELEEIKPQSVSFIEAIKAYAEGKTIVCELGEATNTYSKEFDGGDMNFEMLSFESHAGICANEILNGTWYIKDEGRG